MTLNEICDIIILTAAVLIAITNIYKFFANGGKGIRKKVNENKVQLKEEKEQHIREVFTQIQQEQSEEEKKKVLDTIKEALPDMLLKHDLIIRDRYKADRERYLQDIKKEVVHEVREQLNAIDSITNDVAALAESAKDVLREKIMAIYHKNKRIRQLEEHEKEALEQYYKDYKAIKGNSYIDKYYARTKSWAVIPDDYEEE